MNKIYKVVWNTVRNCYVVGSELISSKWADIAHRMASHRV